MADVAADQLARLNLAARVIAPVDTADARSLLVAAVRGGGRVIAAVADGWIVGTALLWPAQPHPSDVLPAWELLALGVAPAFRQKGLGTALLRAVLDAAGGDPVIATSGVAERDPIEPLPVEARTAVARRMLERAGFRVRPAEGAVGQMDPSALTARHG